MMHNISNGSMTYKEVEYKNSDEQYCSSVSMYINNNSTINSGIEKATSKDFLKRITMQTFRKLLNSVAIRYCYI